MTSHAYLSGKFQQFSCSDSNHADVNNALLGGRYSPDPSYSISSPTYTMAGSSSALSALQKYTPGTTLEPLMMFVDQDSSHWDTTQFYSSDPTNCSGFVAVDSHGLSQNLGEYATGEEPQHYIESSHPASEISVSSPGEDVEDPMDRPYARLIYEALMLAPGHRMMLREIYDWFIQNTNKPQGSNSNGWQNSIRHNLSMNQAFENDRSEQAGSGQARKANSLWYLTEEAIANGVQSTTRFRKSGPPKRSLNQRANQVQRQKSGAKGGKATRRGALLRKRGEASYREPFEACPGAPLSRYHAETAETPAYVVPFGINRSSTPADDVMYQQIYGHHHYRPPVATCRVTVDDTPSDHKVMLQDSSTHTFYDDFARLSHNCPSVDHMFV